MSEHAYRFAAPEDANNGASTILLDMADPADRALGATMMERLAFPTTRHARRAVSDAKRWVFTERAELRRILAMRPDYTNRYVRLMWSPARLWDQARIQCRRVRAARRVLAKAQDRVRRYLEEALQEALIAEAARRPAAMGVLVVYESAERRAA